MIVEHHRLRITSVPHPDGQHADVFLEVGGEVLASTVPADEAPRPFDPDTDCPMCGGAGEVVLWVHGEDEPRSVDPCGACGGTGAR